MQLMATPKKRPAYPSDGKVKYVGIPAEYHAILERLSEGPDERSIAWYARRAVREWLERNGHLPKNGTGKSESK